MSRAAEGVDDDGEMTDSGGKSLENCESDHRKKSWKRETKSDKFGKKQIGLAVGSVEFDTPKLLYLLFPSELMFYACLDWSSRVDSAIEPRM